MLPWHAVAPLMNDTKWREVLELTLLLRIPYEVVFTSGSGYRPGHSVPQSLQAHKVGDPGLSGGGPHSYREILGLRVPRFSRTRDPRSGVLGNDESQSVRYLEGLASLGKIPVEMTEEYIYIHGYSNSDP